MTKALSRFAIFLVLTLGVSVAFAASAGAHAQLTGTTPTSGALLKVQPPEVEFHFSEDVEANFGAINLFGPDGKPIEVSRVRHPGGAGKRIAVGVEGTGPVGAWTAVYRVVSADGHPVSGGVVFYVGRKGTASKSVSELAQPASTSKLVDLELGLARGLGFLAIALALGSVLMLVLVLRRQGRPSDEVANLLVRVVRVGAVIGILAALLGLWGQSAVAGGSELSSALGWDAWQSTLETRFGKVTAAALLAWAFVAASAQRAIRAEKVLAVIPLSAALAFLAAVPALGGHAATQQPIGIFAPLNVVHVMAMSFWVGGVAVLFFLASSNVDYSRIALERFSPLALWAVALVVATGVGQSLLNFDSVGQLLSTPYGRAVLAKALLTVLLVGAGYWQRTRGLPGLRQGTSNGVARIRRALATETVLFACVLGVTAALASYPPASAAVESGPISRSVVSDGVEIQLTLDPAKVGLNQIHLYLFDARTGAQFALAKEVQVTQELNSSGIGSISNRAVKAGIGHWLVQAASFPGAGNWRVKVLARVSEFDQLEGAFSVPVR